MANRKQFVVKSVHPRDGILSGTFVVKSGEVLSQTGAQDSGVTVTAGANNYTFTLTFDKTYKQIKSGIVHAIGPSYSDAVYNYSDYPPAVKSQSTSAATVHFKQPKGESAPIVQSGVEVAYQFIVSDSE